MKRFACVAALLVSLAGCHAPMPSCNMFRPANATRVPPPGTGGYGVTQPYYPTSPAATSSPPAATVPPRVVPPNIAPTSAPVGTGFRPSTANRWSNIDDPAVGPIAKENAWEPSRPAPSNTQVADLRDMDVVLASHETAAPFVPSTVVVERDGPIRILPPDSAPSSPSPAAGAPPRLRGMTVNDATRAAEPRPFVPAGRVIDISQLPDATVSASSSFNQTTTGQSGTTTSRSSTRQAAVIDGGWKTRT